MTNMTIEITIRGIEAESERLLKRVNDLEVVERRMVRNKVITDKLELELMNSHKQQIAVIRNRIHTVLQTVNMYSAWSKKNILPESKIAKMVSGQDENTVAILNSISILQLEFVDLITY